MSDEPVRSDIDLVEAAAREFRDDLRPSDAAPDGFTLGEAWAAAGRLSVPGIPAATDAPDLASVKRLGRACREWLGG